MPARIAPTTPPQPPVNAAAVFVMVDANASADPDPAAAPFEATAGATAPLEVLHEAIERGTKLLLYMLIRPWRWHWRSAFGLLALAMIGGLISSVALFAQWNLSPGNIWMLDPEAPPGKSYYSRDQQMYANCCSAPLGVMAFVVLLHLDFKHAHGDIPWSQLKTLNWQVLVYQCFGAAGFVALVHPKSWESMGYAVGTTVIGAASHMVLGVGVYYNMWRIGVVQWTAVLSRSAAIFTLFLTFYPFVSLTYWRPIGTSDVNSSQQLLTVSSLWFVLRAVSMLFVYQLSVRNSISTRERLKVSSFGFWIWLLVYHADVAALWQVGNKNMLSSKLVSALTSAGSMLLMRITLHARNEFVYAYRQQYAGEAGANRRGSDTGAGRQAATRQLSAHAALLELSASLVLCCELAEFVAIVHAPILAIALEPHRVFFGIGFPAEGKALDVRFLLCSAGLQVLLKVVSNALCWAVLEPKGAPDELTAGLRVLPMTQTFRLLLLKDWDVALYALVGSSMIGGSWSAMAFQRFPPWECDADPCACYVLHDDFRRWCLSFGRLPQSVMHEVLTNSTAMP